MITYPFILYVSVTPSWNKKNLIQSSFLWFIQAPLQKFLWLETHQIVLCVLRVTVWNRLTTSPNTTAKRPFGRSAGCGRPPRETRWSDWPSWCCAETSEAGRRAPHSGSYTSAGPCWRSVLHRDQRIQFTLLSMYASLYCNRRALTSVNLCARRFTGTEGQTLQNHCNSKCSTDGGATVTCVCVWIRYRCSLKHPSTLEKAKRHWFYCSC